MKKRYVLMALTMAWAWSCAVWAQGDEKVLVLRTGEIVRGAAVKEGASYKVVSGVLGPLTIQETDVTSIHEATEASAEWEKRKNQILSDPGAVASLQGMTQDREIMDFVMDPDVQKALKDQDIEALKNNPKFIQFASHPDVQKLAQDLMAKEKQQE